VKLVRAISAKQVEEEDVDYKNMAGLEFKKREMEQQVEICAWRRTWVPRDIGLVPCAGRGTTPTRRTKRVFGLYVGSKHTAVFVLFLNPSMQSPS
jgi:hypothetical protein